MLSDPFVTFAAYVEFLVNHYSMMFKKSFLIIFLTAAAGALFGQNTDSLISVSSLNNQFEILFSNADTFNDYKVIRINRLNNFWKSVSDSIREERRDIDGLSANITELNNEIQTLKADITKLHADLEASRKEADSVSVLGMQVDENTYSIGVWSFIAALLLLIGIGYMSYSRNRILYVRTRKDFEDLHEEFESYRKQSQENKVKLGRELQTERNRVSELMSRLGTRDL